MDKFVINFRNRIIPEKSEILEDVIALVLDALSIEAEVFSEVTGNSTMSPFKHEPNGSVLSKISRMMHNLDVKLGGDTTVLCPQCGSDEIFTCEDDDEMRECNLCGYVWEIDEGEYWSNDSTITVKY
jgi:rubredoxin